MPADEWLEEFPNLNDLKWGIVEKIVQSGYQPEIFSNPKGTPGLASSKPWTAADADAVARRCVGAALIGLPRWTFHDRNDVPVLLPTEFNHYEGALARTLGLPTLALVQENVMRRVVFDYSFSGYLGRFKATDTVNWLNTPQFTVPFGYFLEALHKRRDVFLGYCSRSKETAAQLKTSLITAGATVLDWDEFVGGNTILDQIQKATARCSAGVFLFTQDDQDSPRDNVVLEAGIFTALKGNSNVLIVREAGAKMPADFGGVIYADLKDKADLPPIQSTLQSFIDNL
jgi:hypothetical protein